ncbi:hypothetical protein ACVWW2_006124 [Bradyrhizobium sp. LM4.3]
MRSNPFSSQTHSAWCPGSTLTGAIFDQSSSKYSPSARVCLS